MFLIPMFWTELPTCLHTTMERFLKQLGPFSLLISLTEQGINCANKFFVCMGMCASVQAPGSTQDCAQDNTSCVPQKKKVAILNLHFKAVTDKISNYLRAEQDILEVCNCNEREGIPSLHSRGAACVCAMLRTQKRRVRFRFFVSPLHSALGNHKLPVPLCRRVLCCWGLQPKVVFQDLDVWKNTVG